MSGKEASSRGEFSDRRSQKRRRRRVVRISDTADYDRTADDIRAQPPVAGDSAATGGSRGVAASSSNRNSEGEPETGFSDEYWREQRPPHSVY